mmetsp:Transcript_26444/g.29468  ORF Transcript_26444/g.29468 Transcript_26444/m.29468 type:complete len:202 (-) Transcript_26444:795-1400(-)
MIRGETHTKRTGVGGTVVGGSVVGGRVVGGNVVGGSVVGGRVVGGKVVGGRVVGGNVVGGSVVGGSVVGGKVVGGKVVGGSVVGGNVVGGSTITRLAGTGSSQNSRLPCLSMSVLDWNGNLESPWLVKIFAAILSTEPPAIKPTLTIQLMDSPSMREAWNSRALLTTLAPGSVGATSPSHMMEAASKVPKALSNGKDTVIS